MPPPGAHLAAVRPALQTPAELLAAGRPADAAEALMAVVAETPTYAAAHVLLGVALDAAGRPAEALEAWNRAAFLVPRSPLVLRERQRLLDASRAAEPPPQTEKPGLAPPEPRVQTLEPEVQTLEPLPQTVEPEVQHPEPPIQTPEPGLQTPEPQPQDDEPPTIETASLDDFIFADPTLDVAGGPEGFDPLGGDPDALDPDGFDFSAFDLGEDEDWLTPPDDSPADDSLTDAAPADWDDLPEPEPVRLILPDDAPPAPTPAADDAWAVFEDLPAAPAASTPSAADLLTPDGASAAPAAPDDWLVDAPAAPAQDMPGDADAVGGAVGSADVPPPPPPSEPPPRPLAGPPQGGGPSSPWTVSQNPFGDTPGTDTPDPAPPSASVFAEPEATEARTVADELDLLIASLETAPRIRPDPTFAGPAVRVPAADTGEMASETLARIYAAQHQYVQAALVYETLAAREPERAEALLGQAAEMRARRP